MQAVNNVPIANQCQYTMEEIVRMRKNGIAKPKTVTWAQWSSPFQLTANHQRMCYMEACGIPRRRIEEECDISPSRLSQILTGEEAVMRVKEIQFDVYGKNNQKRFESLVSSSIDVIKDIRDDISTAPSTRLSAANTLIDRALGKSVQKVELRDSTLRDLYGKLDEYFPAMSNLPKQDIENVDFKEIKPDHGTQEQPKTSEIDLDAFMEKHYGEEKKEIVF